MDTDGTYTIPDGQTNLYIALESLNSGGKGNLIILNFF